MSALKTRGHTVVTKEDAIFVLLLLLRLFILSSYLLYLPQNKRDRLETLAQNTELLQNDLNSWLITFLAM